MTMAEHWRELVTTAMLGTDRRDPPGRGRPDSPTSSPTPCGRRRPSGCSPRSPRAPPCAAPACCPGPPVDRLAGPDHRRSSGVRAGCGRAVAPHHDVVAGARGRVDAHADHERLACRRPSSSPQCCGGIAPIRSAEPAPRSPAGRWPAGSSSTFPNSRPGRPGAPSIPRTLGELPDLPIPPDLIELLGAPDGDRRGARRPRSSEVTRRTAPSRDGEPDRQGPAGVARRHRVVPRGGPLDIVGVRPGVGPGRPGAHPPPHARRTSLSLRPLSRGPCP